MTKEKTSYRVIGLMSGTSLDGLDIAYCSFVKRGAGWSFEIIKGETVKYNKGWKKALADAHQLSGEELIKLDHDYGVYLADAVTSFIRRHQCKADFISSHGHTVFHQPHSGFTYQLGNGQTLSAVTAMPVVCDFRSFDVKLGGQGAPLVPIGDRHLFADYDVCLNLGGIANISAEEKKSRVAYDVCFCNMGLNYLAEKEGKTFDKGGLMAMEGDVNKTLLSKLVKAHTPFRSKRPSLGRELFERKIQPLLDAKGISVHDRLRTFTELIAMEIVEAVTSIKDTSTVLCTGGGAQNSFLISRMLDLGGDLVSWQLPEKEVIDFKEALIFAFLGVLRVRDEVNCLKSVTGASRDSSSGLMIGFKM